MAAAPLETPFTVNLAPGDYVLVAENGGLTGPLGISVTLREGEPLVVTEPMPGFNANRIVDLLLGNNR